MEVGPRKFVCGRKKKFGLNVQDTCDAFLDVEIAHCWCDATSDYLAFVTSELKSKIKKPGFLTEGLVRFSDNMYVSNDYKSLRRPPPVPRK